MMFFCEAFVSCPFMVMIQSSVTWMWEMIFKADTNNLFICIQSYVFSAATFFGPAVVTLWAREQPTVASDK